MRHAAAGIDPPRADASHPTDSGNRSHAQLPALAALAGAADEAAWIDATLDALTSSGLQGVHLLLPCEGGHRLAGSRGLPATLESALRAGDAVPGIVSRSLLAGAARVGWIDEGPAQEGLALALAIAEAALRRLRNALPEARSDEGSELVRLRQEVADLAIRERALRDRQQHFEDTLASVPIALATQDRELRYTWVHAPDFLPGVQMVGRTDSSLLDGPDAWRLQLLRQRVLDTGEPVHAEITLSDGTGLRTFQLVVDPVRDPQGAITGIATAAIDITARAREAGAREQLLLEREDERSWLFTVIERLPVGILLIESEGAGERITANRRASELLGHPVDPAQARRLIAGRLLLQDGKPIAFEDLPSSRALRGERVSMEEGLLRSPDGASFPIVISASPIVDAAGRRAGAVVTFDDISPVKELERLREQWTSLITHDLRQPVTSIGGFASLLADHPDLPAHLRSKVVHIVAAAKRLGRMTADLLEASRLETKQLELERRPTDICVLAQEAVERLRPEMQDHPVQVEVADELPLLSIDPDRFEQVLGNLLSNAAKYSPPGSPIVLGICRSGCEALVTITNEGGELPAEEFGQIFRRFHRTDAARRSRSSGLGLGLYIVRGLVEAHGGRIWVETGPEGRVIFRFSLPLVAG